MRKNQPSLVRGLKDLFASRPFGELFQKFIRLWQREGFRGMRRAILTIGRFQISYSRWVRSYDTLTSSDRKLIQEHMITFKHSPVFSLFLSVGHSDTYPLHVVIESIRGQLYPHWELCIFPSSSTSGMAQETLRALQQSDTRIKVATNTVTASQLPIAMNASLSMATGEFLVLLGSRNELSEHALYLVADAINRNGELALIYGDEDKLDERGRRATPFFKPDWNPDLFFSYNYLQNFAVYRTESVRSAGNFSAAAAESYSWDLALRVVEQLNPAHICHIPHVLSHQHTINEPTALQNEQENVEREAAIRVLEDFWLRQGLRVCVKALDRGLFQTVYPIPDPPPLVSIIIPTRNGLTLLSRCLEGLFSRTDYPNKEIIVVDNCSDDPATKNFLAELARKHSIRLLRYDAAFNYSAINNMAVSQAAGELVCLLNNDIDPINPGWLGEMVSHAVRHDIGSVGAMLYYPDDTIQHAGVVLNGIVAGHLYVGFPRGYAGEALRGGLVQNLSAVTAACMLVKKAVWDEVGGMDEGSLTVAFNDVDFCLKVRQIGYRNLWTPFAELYHHESASRGREDTPEKMARVKDEIACMQQRWGDVLNCDPAWNANLELDGSWPRPAHPPRSKKPWKHADAS